MKRFELSSVSGDRIVKGRIEEDGRTLKIFLDGYGCDDTEPGYAPVVELELYEDKVNALVIDDVRSGTTKLICLEGANESKGVIG